MKTRYDEINVQDMCRKLQLSADDARYEQKNCRGIVMANVGKQPKAVRERRISNGA
jgi:hypothetical protein